MIISSIARRYSKALFDLASEENKLEEILQEYQRFLELLKEKKSLYLLIKLPDVLQREKALTTILQQHFSPLFINFLLTVTRNRRYYLLQQIFEDLQHRYDLAHNRIRAQAITAIPLTDKNLALLNNSLSRYLNAEVRTQNKVDPSILGGIIIRLDGKIFNASLREQFNKLKQHLIKNQK